MKQTEKLQLLFNENKEQLKRAADQLAVSLRRCQSIDLSSELNIEQQEKLEALTSRFARLSDLITQKSLRLIEKLDLELSSSFIDRINLAEKKGLIKSADEFIQIRQLRNAISHDYDMDALVSIFASCIKYAPQLIETVDKILVDRD